jgi:ankyrin repeat protein
MNNTKETELKQLLRPDLDINYVYKFHGWEQKINLLLLLHKELVVTPYPRDAIYSWILNYSEEYPEEIVSEMKAQARRRPYCLINLAVKLEEHKILKLLLVLFHKYNILQEVDMTLALCSAVKLDDPIACNILLEYDFTADFTDHYPLIFSMIGDNLYISCSTILNHPRSAEFIDLNFTDRDLPTPLMYCIHEDKINFARLLLQAGADPNKAGGSLFSQILIENNCEPEWFELFIKYGMDIQTKYSEEYFNRTPLLFAASKINGYYKVIPLITAGADVSVIDSKGYDLLDLLLRTTNDEPECTVLEFLMGYNSVRQLWNRKYQKRRPKIFEINWFTVYTCAAKCGMNIHETMTLNGVEKVPFLFWTYVNEKISSVYDRFEMLKAVIESGFNIKSLDSAGNNILHYVVKNKSITKEEIEYCIQKGLDLSAVNHAGKTPRDLAINPSVKKLIN